MLAQALNKGTKPPIIADRIEVKELNMGTIPPELEILEIGDLSTDRFRGIFRLTYTGDAYIVLQTRVQANPLNVPRPSLDILNAPRILFAAAPLVVPMTLRLSNLSLRAIVVLVVSRQKGITLVFKNDPLEKVDVSSSFDGVESVAGFIQREIENQLREAFRSDLPSVIHRLSQKWLSGEVKSAGKAAGSFKAAHKVGGLVGEGFDKDAKIETRTAYDAGRASAEVHGLGEHGGGGPTTRGRAHTRRMSARDSDTGESLELAGSQVDSTWSTWAGNRMTRGGGGSGDGGGLASSRYSATSSDPYPGSRSPSLRRLASRSSAGQHHHHSHQSTQRASSSGPSSLVSHDQLDSVPESIESYDPTYGLRPDSIPHHAGFKNYEKLVKGGSSRRGLGEVLSDAAADGLGADGLSPDSGHRDPYDDEYDEAAGLGGEDGDLEPDSQYYSSSSSHFETIPAVGGGTITRPRVFHTQSQMRFGPGVASSAYDPASAGSLTAHGSPSSVTARSAAGGSTASTLGLGRSASFYGGHVRSASAGGAFATPYGNGSGGGGLAARFSSGASSSGASSARFPFPRHPPSYSFQGGGPSRAGSSIVRNTSMPALSRHATSSSSHPAPRVDPPLATPTLQHRTHRGGVGGGGGVEPEPESDQLAFTRPSPVDLLSRSPSSLLNTSFLDEEHLPITLNPSGNDSCAHLATLTSSNQTLSPFTRDHAHVTARSSPHLGGAGPGGSADEGATGGALRVASVPRGRSELLFGKAAPANMNGQQQQQQQQQPVKAIRKRLHRIGSAKVGSGSSSMPGGGALSGYASPGSPAMPNSPVMVGASTFSGGIPQAGYHYNHRSSSIPSSSAYPQSQTDSRRQGGQHHRRSTSAYSSLSPSRYAAAAAASSRTAPSPFSVTRGKVSLASDYGTAMATGAAGVGAHKTAPSELSDYFPPAVTSTMADMEAVAGSSAREMLSRMGLH
ncbi:hypothetical protein B0A53_05494 [Rhodotorula sp. CCFEE 5036]|nr:hypothetical protein B0A53_05494 [Rhodotorula sp. CCFEE 5036]